MPAPAMVNKNRQAGSCHRPDVTVYQSPTGNHVNKRYAAGRRKPITRASKRKNRAGGRIIPPQRRNPTHVNPIITPAPDPAAKTTLPCQGARPVASAETKSELSRLSRAPITKKAPPCPIPWCDTLSRKRVTTLIATIMTTSVRESCWHCAFVTSTLSRSAWEIFATINQKYSCKFGDSSGVLWWDYQIVGY